MYCWRAQVPVHAWLLIKGIRFEGVIMGCEPISLEIAEAVFAIEFDGCSDAPPVGDAIQSFFCTGKPQTTIHVRNLGHLNITLSEENQVFHSGAHWRLHRVDGKTVLVSALGPSTASPDSVVIFDPDFGDVEAYVNFSGPRRRGEILMADPRDQRLSQVFMICFLARKRGLLLHACGVNDNGRGYLFVGNSGDGKSTIAKLWAGHAEVLNDDRIILRPRNRGFWIFGTPWHGEYKSVSHRGVPLEKVFFLGSSNINIVSPVKDATAVQMLLVRSFPPLWDIDGMSFTLGFIERLTREVPFYTLGFVPDRNIVDFVRCVK